MNLPPDPMAEGWQTLWLAIVGGVVYAALDLLVLRKNTSFQRGSRWFRGGFLVLWVGVVLGAVAWFAFAKGKAAATTAILWCSYAVRAVGVIGLVGGLLKMRNSNVHE